MSDDFVRTLDQSAPRTFVDDTKSAAERLAQSKALDDQEWNARKSLDPKVVQKVWEDWHELNSVNHQSVPGAPGSCSKIDELDASDRDAEKKAALELARALHTACYRELRQQNLLVKQTMPNGEGDGLVMHICDAENRRFDVEIKFDEAGSIMSQTGGERPFRSLVDHVCRQALRSREHYFARMQ